MSNKIDSPREEVSGLAAPTKKLYNDELHAELLELQSDTELLFKQLQSLSRQRLSECLTESLSGSLTESGSH
ncbi:hypothetical protein TUMEXPCC7403_19400 [Tumidithrix helvetica PCC 7403]|uniref:hypothetical protein n=1 Tax=Tumidithrix helvetica TaxID=3457545 RepID=UPI003C98A259